MKMVLFPFLGNDDDRSKLRRMTSITSQPDDASDDGLEQKG